MLFDSRYPARALWSLNIALVKHFLRLFLTPIQRNQSGVAARDTETQTGDIDPLFLALGTLILATDGNIPRRRQK